jgi:hypothetical protein
LRLHLGIFGLATSTVQTSNYVKGSPGPNQERLTPSAIIALPAAIVALTYSLVKRLTLDVHPTD